MFAALASSFLMAAWAPPAIFDVHLHSHYPQMELEASRARFLDNVESGKLSGGVIDVLEYDQLEYWAADKRFLIGIPIGCGLLTSGKHECFAKDRGWADIGWLEAQIHAGKVAAFHEVAPIYTGWQIGNPRYEPYLVLAEKYDVPIGFHVGRGPGPEVTELRDQFPNFDPAAGNPETLRPILERHPKLRIWLQHIGAGGESAPPFLDESIALMKDFPNVSCDLSVTNSMMPLQQYEATLRRLFDEGLTDRIMFGSDNYHHDFIRERMDKIAWLTEAQKRAILYGNAAHFFRLDPAGAK